MKRSTFSALLLLLLTVSFSFARPNQDDEAAAPAKLMKTFAFLEQRPLDSKAKEMRGWALKWITATDKVSVKTCSLLVSGIDQNYQYKSEIFGQYLIGMAAFKLGNPTKANDEAAAQLFGVQSALNSYAAIIRTQPQAANAFLNDLVTKRGRGDFATFVAEHNCQGNN
jgi:hypothetical protein